MPSRRPYMLTHQLRVFAGNANRPLAEEIAAILGTRLGRCSIERFPDTEVHVMIDDLVRSQDIFLIQPCPAPVNDHLMELLLLVDAFRRASAHSITVVVPYFPYARQDRMSRGREAISARVVATMMETLGVTRVIYIDIHAPAIQGFFTVPVDPLSGIPVLAQHFRSERFRNATIVSPDVGRAKHAGKYAEFLGLPLVLMYKRHVDGGGVRVTHVVGDIKDRIPIVIDDVIAGGSIIDELPALVEAGARPEIYLAVTHPVLVGKSLAKLDNPIIKELVVTNTIPLPPEKQHKKVQVVSVGPLLADAIRRIHEGITVGPLVQPF
ncbi:MAG: ribose-phosphate diphosphokinase [Anaerolineae bacterium]|nr:ribose-phosphate diphosphokinase [Anaerolineae bacterium]